jgi:hypothetical protein
MVQGRNRNPEKGSGCVLLITCRSRLNKAGPGLDTGAGMTIGRLPAGSMVLQFFEGVKIPPDLPFKREGNSSIPLQRG